MNKHYFLFIIVLYVFCGNVFANTIISTSEANNLNVDTANKGNIIDKSCK